MDAANTTHGDLGELQQIDNLILSQEEENYFWYVLG